MTEKKRHTKEELRKAAEDFERLSQQCHEAVHGKEKTLDDILEDLGSIGDALRGVVRKKK